MIALAKKFGIATPYTSYLVVPIVAKVNWPLKLILQER